jgi:hypothetical protein
MQRFTSSLAFYLEGRSRAKFVVGTLGLLFAIALIANTFLPPVSAAENFGTYLGQFRTVAAFSNSGTKPINSNNFITHPLYGNGVYAGVKWECVEYVRRFYLSALNLNVTWSGHGWEWFSKASEIDYKDGNTLKEGFDSFANDAQSRPPAVGDILGYSTLVGGGFGHVAIIKRVRPTYIVTAQQNWINESSDLSRKLPLTNINGKYKVGETAVTGWLRPRCEARQSSAKWHPDGSLLLDSSGAVWLIEKGVKRLVPDELTFVTRGYSWCSLIRATVDEINAFPTNDAATNNERLVLRSDGAIFRITDRNTRQHIVSMEVFYGLGFSEIELERSDSAANVPDDANAPRLTAPYPDGTLIRDPANQTVYVITNGRKRPIATGSAFSTLGYDFNRVLVPDSGLFGRIETDPNPAIDDCEVARGICVTPNPTGSIEVRATLNGQPWSGAFDYSIVGPSTVDLHNHVPVTIYNRPTGDYRVNLKSNGPDHLGSISPTTVQTLGANGNLTFTFNFGGAGGGEVQPPSFNATANFTPSALNTNQMATVSVVVANTGGTFSGAITDVEIINAGGQKVWQQSVENQNFAAGESKSYSFSWTPNATGTYQLKVGVFAANWSPLIYWNDQAATVTVSDGGSTPPPSPTYDLQVWWPTNGAQVSGTQPFQVMLTNLSVDNYRAFWQVDGGGLNEMSNSFVNYPHKEYIADLSGWTWRGTGPYQIRFVATNFSGTVLAEHTVQIYVTP